MPMTQVRTRPCDLPPVSLLAIRPAIRPSTIHAMMPMTDSLVSDVGAVRGCRYCWADRGRRKSSPGRSHRPLIRSVLPEPVRVRKRKSGPMPAAANNAAKRHLGPEFTFYNTLTLTSRIGQFATYPVTAPRLRRGRLNAVLPVPCGPHRSDLLYQLCTAPGETICA